MKKVCFDVDVVYDTKNALVCVILDDAFETNIHIAWLVSGGVAVFEYISENYPPASLFFFPSIKEYLEAIKKVDWIWNNISKERKQVLFALAKS